MAVATINTIYVSDQYAQTHSHTHNAPQFRIKSPSSRSMATSPTVLRNSSSCIIRRSAAILMHGSISSRCPMRAPPHFSSSKLTVCACSTATSAADWRPAQSGRYRMSAFRQAASVASMWLASSWWRVACSRAVRWSAAGRMSTGREPEQKVHHKM